MAGHHSKELTEKSLKHWEQEYKSTEARDKDESEKKVEWFKENWMVEKTHKPQNLLQNLLNLLRSVDGGNAIGALLTDLSKAFDCLDHKLLIAKLMPMVLVYLL